ncbi:MAG: alanine dehydrogenase, partial [Bacteroidales bacterium]
DKNKLVIGVPREVSEDENRVALVPEAVQLLSDRGHQVLVEEYAGSAAHFTNQAYAEAGAVLTSGAKEIYQADIILKIAPPTESEIDMLARGKTLFSSVFLPNSSKKYFVNLSAKKPNALAFEYIQDKSGALPVMKSMSEIIGNTTILVASQLLCSVTHGKGVMLGGFPGIKPTEVVIIGAGTVAEYAARMALGMGAFVKIFDDSIFKLRHIQNMLGQRIYTSTMLPKLLDEALIKADVVIAAKYAAQGISSYMIPEQTVKKMKPGSVIVDASIDQGGCFETSRLTTHTNPVYQLHEVTHYCVPNIASSVPHTASISLSNILTPMILQIAHHGDVHAMIKRDQGFAKGVYLYNGILTNKHMGHLFGLPFQDLELLISAFSQ